MDHGANLFGRLSSTKHGRTNPLLGESSASSSKTPDILENQVCLGVPDT